MSWFSDAVDDVGSFFGDDTNLSDQVDPSSWFGSSTPSTGTSNTSTNSNSNSFLNAVGGGISATTAGSSGQSNPYSLIQNARDPQVRGAVNPIDLRATPAPSEGRPAQTVDGTSVSNWWMTMMKSMASGSAK